MATVFELAAALERVDGDLPFLEQLGNMFFERWPAQLAELQKAAAAGDVHQTQRIAHAAKGNLASLSAIAGYEAALAIDLATKANTLMGVPEMIDRLAKAVDAFRTTFRAAIENSSLAAAVPK